MNREVGNHTVLWMILDRRWGCYIHLYRMERENNVKVWLGVSNMNMWYNNNRSTDLAARSFKYQRWDIDITVIRVDIFKLSKILQSTSSNISYSAKVEMDWTQLYCNISSPPLMGFAKHHVEQKVVLSICRELS